MPPSSTLSGNALSLATNGSTPFENSLPGLDFRQLHPSILFGIAPALCSNHDCTYWGTTAAPLDQLHRTLFGARQTITSTNSNSSENHSNVITLDYDFIETIRCLAERLGFDDGADGQHNVYLTANQAMAHLRHTVPDHANLILPASCTEPPPDIINTYGDGSYAHPHNHSISIGAAGVWVPSDATPSTTLHSNPPPHHTFTATTSNTNVPVPPSGPTHHDDTPMHTSVIALDCPGQFGPIHTDE